MDLQHTIAHCFAQGLWIDDRKDTVEMSCKVLSRRGIVCDIADDPEEGVAILERNASRFDLVLLDLDMPKLNGIEALRRIRNIDPKLEVVVVSGHLGEPLWQAKLGSVAPAPQSIEKPFPVQVGPIIDELAHAAGKTLVAREDKAPFPSEATLKLALGGEYERSSAQIREEIRDYASEVFELAVMNYVLDNTDRNATAQLVADCRLDETLQKEIVRSWPFDLYRAPEVLAQIVSDLTRGVISGRWNRVWGRLSFESGAVIARPLARN